MNIRVGLAGGAMAALASLVAIAGLAGLTGCGAAGGGNAAASFNGPFGLGGPFARVTSGQADGLTVPGQAVDVTGRADKVTVTGSTVGMGADKVPWLFVLGAGVDITAPQVVRPGADSPADAAAGFYEAFYARRFGTACRYVAAGQRAGCLAVLARSSRGTETLRASAIGYVATKGDKALVTMTGVLCHRASDCVGQYNAHWAFSNSSYTFDQLWSLAATEGGNPVTVTPFSRAGGRWYLELRRPA